MAGLVELWGAVDGSKLQTACMGGGWCGTGLGVAGVGNGAASELGSGVKVAKNLFLQIVSQFFFFLRGIRTILKLYIACDTFLTSLVRRNTSQPAGLVSAATQ